MLKLNSAFVSEIKKHLPKNINPPITLELLLKQKSVDKIDPKNSIKDINNNMQVSKKAFDNFIRNNSAKPFSLSRQKESIKQSILLATKNLLHHNIHIKGKFMTPFQIQHLRMNYQRQKLENKKKKKFPNFEIINMNKKNNSVDHKKNKSNNLLSMSPNSLSHFSTPRSRHNIYRNAKFIFLTPTKYRTLEKRENKFMAKNNKKNKLKVSNEAFNSFVNEPNIKLINEYIQVNQTLRVGKKIKYNCFNNKILNKNLSNLFTNLKY